MSKTLINTAAVDVRQDLSRRIAGILNSGTTHVRVRMFVEQERPVRAQMLGHSKNTWHEEGPELNDAARLASLNEDLAMLASQGQTGDVQIRQIPSAEFVDTDFQFRSDWVENHRGERLPSYIEGVLFFEPHGGNKDVRRQIRTPHHGA